LTTGSCGCPRSSPENATLRLIINKSAGKFNQGLVGEVWGSQFSHAYRLQKANALPTHRTP
jgi:hypothetical protein